MSGNIVFFLPCAGGSASAYSAYQTLFQDTEIEVICHEYNGHGKKYSSAFSRTIFEEAELFVSTYEKELVNRKYILFGHSYGGLVIYEICRLIKRKGLNTPDFVYLSSCILPIEGNHLELDTTYDGIKKLTSDVHMTSSEITENKEIFDFFYPVIKNDIENIKRYQPVKQVLGIKARLCSGTEECLNGFEDWNKIFYILGHEKYTGDHGYIQKNENAKAIVASLINDFHTYHETI